MKTLKFVCRLLSDVVINQKAATEGSNATLNFIPGNVFLGIVASHYGDFGDKALEVFHSGRVRFGDAHPISQSYSGVRSLHVPSSMFYPKLKGLAGGCYISHFYHREDDHENAGSPQQLKQCRNGFYAFGNNKGLPAVTEKSFAIKSAYDRSNRRSRDNMMFGYESLCAGARFLFEVQIDDESIADSIKQMLVGIHYIGRSRTAQYGQVEIKPFEYEDTPSTQQLFTIDDKQYATVYADGRLIFIDDDGEPTFMPNAKDLGIVGGEIVWDLSQVRTFSYAPWNGKRSTRDAEHCGIEKGSVFVIRIDKAQPFSSTYVGMFRNEGFGKVIYNPAFLSSDGNNGVARFKLEKAQDASATNEQPLELSGTPLLDFLKRKKDETLEDKCIYEAVNKFVKENKSRFSGRDDNEKFASQWGTIRSIAMQERNYDGLMEELFYKTKIVSRTLENKEENEPNAYLTHGVAKTRWEKNGRREALRQFIVNMHSQEMTRQFGDITGKALVNLAAEMAKISK